MAIRYDYFSSDVLSSGWYSLIPVENERRLGLLLCGNVEDGELTKVTYVRSGKEMVQGQYERLRLGKQDDLYVVLTPGKSILPLPSKVPFTLCELTEGEYIELGRKFISSEKKIVKSGIDEAIGILAKRTNFSAKMKGFFWCRELRLVTPKGYADCMSSWYAMLNDDFYGDTTVEKSYSRFERRHH